MDLVLQISLSWFQKCSNFFENGYLHKKVIKVLKFKIKRGGRGKREQHGPREREREYTSERVHAHGSGGWLVVRIKAVDLGIGRLGWT